MRQRKYRHRSGETRPDRNPPFPTPGRRVTFCHDDTGAMWLTLDGEAYPLPTLDEGERVEVAQLIGPRVEGYIKLGYAPAPRTRWQSVVSTVAHGIEMRYPLSSVLAFAWRYR